MAAVLETKDAAAKHNSQVDEQIAQATSRIRTHDLAFGGLTLAALVLVYATAMIVLDKYLNLPEWARQAALAGFLVVLAGTAYLTIFSPLRKRINPLYAAKQVENTIDDAKNSVTGYIDARENGDLNPTVKAALASKAAKAAAEADVNKAVDHRSLAYLGGVAIAFLLALIVLFFLFRPAQFASLVGRTFVPFSSGVIQSRTQLTLVKPDPAEATITTGQSISMAVHVGGKVPAADGPEKVRLLIRHNPADPNYDELPMVQGATTRDWELRVPDYLVQNGFWYKVAAGDAVTPEYKVTVRSLPMFSSFQTTYEYPTYLRRKNDTSDDPVIKAYRGTTVTLVAKTNRPVRDGLMSIEPGTASVAGTPDPADPTALRFVFKLTESGKYRLTFNATNGERTADPFQGTITVESDAAPNLVINNPEADETTEPANGIVKIDGKVGDDFGVDTVTLKMKIVSPVERPLPDKPFLNGKSPSFRREKDGTWPTDVDYKDSVDLATLKKDAAGLPLELTPDMVIEYWLEAADNCTEPKPNVGVSKPKRVRLTAPKVEEMAKQELDREKEQRKGEEKKHNDDQQKKFDKENRQPKKNGQQGEQNGEGNKGDDQPKPEPGAKEDNPPKQPADPKEMGMPGMGTETGAPAGPKGDPKTDGKTDPKDAKGGNADPNVDKTADDLKRELDQANKDGGLAKPNNAPREQDRTEPAQPKPQPKGDMGMGGASEPKPGPPEPKNDPANPMGKGDAPPAATKPEGDLQKPEDPSAPKPEPKQPDPKGGKNDAAPSENRGEPFGGAPGTEKEPPKEPQPAPKDPNAKQDPNSGSRAKPATEKKDGAPAGMPNPEQKPDPAGDAGSRAKPMQEPKRGEDKPQPRSAEPNGPKPGEPDAGDAKPQAAPPAAGTKPQPKEGPMAKGQDADPKPAPGANDPMMKPNQTNAAESRADEEKKDPPGAGGKSVDKGTDKPQRGEDKPGANGGNDAPMPKQIDENQRKELQQAANDLTNPDDRKKQEARDKLDKAVGQEKRKELEKAANDAANAPDEKSREEARRKLEEMKKQLDGKKDGKGPGDTKKDPPQKLTEQQKKEIQDAVNDLQNPDPTKKREAQEKLDKMVGQQNRKDAEQAMQDLKSDDKEKREAAQKKLDDLKKELEKQGQKGDGDQPKGKEPTPEELDDLAKKAQDLNSKDAKTREQAQKELDQKIGEENRKQLEEMMKNQKPGDPMEVEKLKEKLKEQRKDPAKNPPKKPDDDFNPMGPGAGTPAKGPMDEDKKNRLKSAELNLEEFKKEENRKLLQNKKGWTDAEYEKFLKEYEDYVKRLRDEAKRDDGKPIAPGPKEAGAPIGAGSGGKVDALGGPATGGSGIGGPTVAPPGFEDAKRRFEEALKKKP